MILQYCLYKPPLYHYIGGIRVLCEMRFPTT